MTRAVAGLALEAKLYVGDGLKAAVERVACWHLLQPR